jgi:phage repressor protein C with HTH and peptisase S24 domain
MEPTLREGDWLLVDPDSGAPTIGDLVVADDPRQIGRLVVKRVKSLGPAQVLVIGGDHPAHANEELRVPLSAVHGRAWFRYWPLPRAGRVH